MNSKPTIGQLADFIWSHKTLKYCTGRRSILDIVQELKDAIERNGLLYAMEEGNVVGVVYFKPSPEDKTFHVQNLLTVKKWCTREFLVYFNKNFNGYKMQALRKNKLVKYNTTRFVNKLMKA